MFQSKIIFMRKIVCPIILGCSAGFRIEERFRQLLRSLYILVKVLVKDMQGCMRSSHR